MDDLGNLKKTYETEYEVEVHWKITNFLSRFENTSSVESPTFIWSGGTWELNLNFDEDRVEFFLTNLNLEKETPVIYKSGILMINERPEMRCCLTKTFKEEENCFGTIEFIVKSELLERKHEILPDETLTVYCYIGHLANLKNPERLRKESLDVLSSNLKTLYGCSTNSDITMVVGEERYPVHKIILGARSTVFEAMFRHDTKEVKSGIILVSDCDPASFNDFLLFLYSGKAENLSSSNVCHLYKIAEKYNVQELKSLCLQFMKKNLSLSNFFDIIILANQFDEFELLSLAQEVFNLNAAEIIKEENWEKLMKENFPIANQLLANFLHNLKNEDDKN